VDRRPIGCDRRFEIIDASDVLDDVVTGTIPNIDAKREVGLRLHGRPPGKRNGGMVPPTARDENRTRTQAGNVFGCVLVESSDHRGVSPMMKIAFVAAAAVAVLTTAPVTTPVKAQGVDVQLGRDRDDGFRHRRDSDVTVGVGPGGLGPREHCRTVTTRIERDDGRMITRKERRCD
jgi:hypothetical protein